MRRESYLLIFLILDMLGTGQCLMQGQLRYVTVFESTNDVDTCQQCYLALANKNSQSSLPLMIHYARIMKGHILVRI